MPVPRWKLRKKNDTYEIHDSELGGFTFSVTHLNPKKMTVGHLHDNPETYLILKGKGRIVIGKKEMRIGPLDVITIPSGVFHRVLNLSAEKLIFLCIWELS